VHARPARRPDGRRDAGPARGVRQVGQLVGEVRDDRVVAGDALHRGFEVHEAVLDDAGDDLGPDAAVPRGLVDDDRAAGLADRLVDQLAVERGDAEQVEHFGVDVVLVLQLLGGLERGAQRGAVGDQRHVLAGAGDDALADRHVSGSSGTSSRKAR
jgi:hypothetical protein